jgi:hypothetical protein
MKMVQIRRHPEVCIFVTSCILIWFLAGCADLTAISKFAATSSDAETYKAISGDYVDTLKRRVYYTETKESRDKIAGRIKDRQSIVDGIQSIHLAIYEYMKTLGALAADDLASYDKELDGIAAKLEKANFIKDSKITDTEIKAGNAIAKLLFKAFAEGYRQGKLKKIITEANSPLLDLIACQKIIIQKDYLNSLQLEEEAVDTYYGDVITKFVSKEFLKNKKNIAEYYGDIIVEAKKEPTEKAAMMLLRDKMQEKKDAIKTKKTAAETYIKVLEKIAEGHQFLYDNRNTLSKAQILRTVKGYSSYISNLYTAMKPL